MEEETKGLTEPGIREEIEELKKDIMQIKKSMNVWLNPEKQNLQLETRLQVVEEKVFFAEQRNKKEMGGCYQKLAEVNGRLQQNQREIELLKKRVEKINGDSFRKSVEKLNFLIENEDLVKLLKNIIRGDKKEERKEQIVMENKERKEKGNENMKGKDRNEMEKFRRELEIWKI